MMLQTRPSLFAGEILRWLNLALGVAAPNAHPNIAQARALIAQAIRLLRAV